MEAASQPCGVLVYPLEKAMQPLGMLTDPPCYFQSLMMFPNLTVFHSKF